MNFVYSALSWTFGIIFLLLGVSAAIAFPLAGLCFLAISALLLPPVRKFVHSKTNKELATRTRAISIFVLFIGGSILAGQAALVQQENLEIQQAQEKAQQAEKSRQEAIQDFQANSQKIISAIEETISQKNYSSAISQIDKYIVSGDERLKELREQAQKEIQSIQRAEKTEQLLAELKTVPAEDNERNRSIYAQLIALNPENDSYKSRESLYATRIQEAERAKKAQEERRIANALRNMSKKTDKIDGVDWYRDKSSPAHNNANAFYLYFGKKETGNPWLRLKIQYHANDWLFINSFVVVADGQRFERPAARFERDHSSMIWEWYDESLSASDVLMIRAVMESKEAVIRLNGRQYRRDITITSAQKAALRNVLDAYAVLSGE